VPVSHAIVSPLTGRETAGRLRKAQCRTGELQAEAVPDEGASYISVSGSSIRSEGIRIAPSS